MRHLKIYTTMFCTILLLYLCITNKLLWLLAGIILCVFIKKHFDLKHTLYNYNDITQKALRSQREFFINSLSHDLRIPVIAQLRALELIKNETLGKLNPTQKEMINQTEQSCECIINLISLLINTYNIENSTYSLIYDKFNLYEVILSCFDELLLNATEKNITFEYDCKDKNLFLYADKEEIKKVIKNLLIVSLNYSNYGGTIIVKLKNIDKKLKLSVELKENNHMINESHTFDSRFTAIGESIRYLFCKRIIELHKGQITQNNETLKAFVFELPLSA